jgi:Helix-turn-helix domain
MRFRHRGRRPVKREEVAPPQPGFTPYQCVQIYWLNEQGVNQREIARNLDCSQSTIFRAIRRGEDTFHQWDVPRMLAVGSDLSCGHDKPIQVGDRIVCCKCFVSGYDEVDAMRVTASDLRALDGTPEPKEQKPFAERMHGGGKKKRKRMNLDERKAALAAKLKLATPSIDWAAILAALEPVAIDALEALLAALTKPTPAPTPTPAP